MKSKIIYLSWLIATVATSGSLYLSNVLGYPPCSLCWWQRIGMYPLVLLFATGFIKRDRNCFHYTTPIIVTGFLISAYHNLLYYGVIEKGFTACSADLSCTAKQVEFLMFITIPLMSLTAYSLLLALSIYTIINNRNSNEEK